MAECAVCFQPLAKPRYHYGGLSCYSCRAFFRRTTQRPELPVCKEEGSCPMKQVADRKQCSACRYQQCIRAGMRADLILDEEEKKTRFRKALEKKKSLVDTTGSLLEPKTEVEEGLEASRVKQEPNLPELGVLGPPRTIYQGPQTTMRAQMSPPANRHFYPRASPTSPFHLPQSPHSFPSQHQAQQSTTSIPLSPHHHMKPFSPLQMGTQQPPFHPSPNPQSPMMSPPCSPALSILSDVSGMMRAHPAYQRAPRWPAPASYTPSSCQAFYPATNFSSSVFPPMVKEEPVELTEDMKAWETLVAERTTPTYQPNNSYEKPTTSKISYDRLHEAFGDVIRVKVENTVGENIQEMIDRYTHKKLRQQRKFSLKSNDFEFEFGSKGLEITDINPVPKKRKSVIVRAGDNRSDKAKESNEDGEESDAKDIVELTDIDTSIGDIIGLGDTGELLTGDTIQPMLWAYCEEEGRQLQQITEIFSEEWHQLNFGSNIVAEYIHFCEYKPEFAPAFFKTVNLTIRERCLAFISCLEELEHVSYQDKIDLFKKNLDNVEMLAYVFSFNRGSADEEVKFVLGTADMEQWKGRGSHIQGANLSAMVSFMPISEEDKFTLYTNFMKCSMTLLKDYSTFVLMILIVAFDGASQGSVAAKLRANFHKMLARYLTQKRKGANVQEDISNIYECISVLPQLAKPFQGIKYFYEILKSSEPVK